MHTGKMILSGLVFSVSLCLCGSNAAPPRSVAETSEYRETSRHADVVEFCRLLAKESPLVRVAVFD
jgi:hypothetical protein